jgi:RsiW-degrading membrane proteinase PrsW (M82 family)
MSTIWGCLAVGVLAVSPGLWWLYYFYKRDALDPEPLNLVRNSFILGAFSTIPAAIISSPFTGNPFISTVVVAPIVEESCKCLIVYLYAYRKRQFDEPMDGVIYAAATALGFATLENLLYVGRSYAQGDTAVTALARAFFSVPGHAVFSSMWGAALGVMKCNKEARSSILVAGLALAMALHAAFNFMCSLGIFWLVGMAVCAPLAWHLVESRITSALKRSPFEHIELVDTIPQPVASPSPRPSSWYDNKPVVATLLFVAPPVAMYALFRSVAFSLPLKLSYGALSALWCCSLPHVFTSIVVSM